jgi:hypothetical protein
MKKIQTIAVSIAALLGLGAALAFKPHHKLLEFLIQVRQNSVLSYTYFNVSSPVSHASCTFIEAASDCTFSSTNTAAFFNTYNQTAIPVSDGIHVSYINFGVAYKQSRI